jgi:hypothetical protein
MTRSFTFLLALIFFSAIGNIAHAQDQSKTQVIQLTGIVYSADSINEKLPFVSIKVKGTTRGSVSDLNGFY